MVSRSRRTCHVAARRQAPGEAAAVALLRQEALGREAQPALRTTGGSGQRGICSCAGGKQAQQGEGEGSYDLSGNVAKVGDVATELLLKVVHRKRS